jgi:hypothetical protein
MTMFITCTCDAAGCGVSRPSMLQVSLSQNQAGASGLNFASEIAHACSDEHALEVTRTGLARIHRTLDQADQDDHVRAKLQGRA